jgi:hypothetical protein
MIEKLHYHTIKPQLKSALDWLMAEDIFNPFRLVGGTALSLQLGHRESVDIDMFSDLGYGDIDFEEIGTHLKNNFDYVDSLDTAIVGMGKSYFIGDSANDCIKLDLYYTDPFIRPYIEKDNIRLANLDDIVAMKVDIVSRGARKKDFWDLHELLNIYTIEKMLELHKERYEYSHNREEIIANFINFENADNDFEPICLLGKFWEIIKLDFVDLIEDLGKS